MGAFRDPSTINNVGAIGSATNPLTGSALGMDRENQKAIKELIGTLDWESLSILDGGITPVSSEINVDTEDETPADDLTTINLTSDRTTSLHTGMRIKIKSADPSRVITVKHLTGGGNIRTADGQDVVLSNDWSLDLKLQNGVWVEQKERGYVVVTESLGQVTESLGQVTESLGQVTESLGQVTESLGEVQVQGTASWSLDGAPYPISAQVYHNGKQWLALRANSVEPAEGEDWTELLGVVPVTRGGTGAATANQGRVNLGAAPNPTSSSQVGRWFGFSHAAPKIPEGGTWVVWWIGFNPSNVPVLGPSVGFVPGGTSPGTTSKYFGVAWRLE